MVSGFNIGANISLGDMSLALAYIQDKENTEDGYPKNREELVKKSMEPRIKSVVVEDKFADVVSFEDVLASDSNAESFEKATKTGTQPDLEEVGIIGDEEDYEEEYDDANDEDDEDESDLLDEFGGDSEDEDEDFNLEEEDDDDGENLEELDPEVELEEGVRLEDLDDREDDSRIAEEITVIETKTMAEPSMSAEISEPEIDDEEAELLKQLEEARKKRESAERKAKLREQLEEEERKAKQAEEYTANLVEGVSPHKVERVSAEPVVERTKPEPARPDTDSNTTTTTSKPHRITVEQYSAMSIDTLYSHVNHYMKQAGVSKRMISKNELEDKFGKTNINKLILKSYLVVLGKGVTTSR
jgi:hypothetical protein